MTAFPEIQLKANVSSSDINKILGLPSKPKSRPRPGRDSLSKRASWRLKKKWFNRYEKQFIMTLCVGISHKDGQQIPTKIIGARLIKRGGHMADIEFKTEPI